MQKQQKDNVDSSKLSVIKNRDYEHYHEHVEVKQNNHGFIINLLLLFLFVVIVIVTIYFKLFVLYNQMIPLPVNTKDEQHRMSQTSLTSESSMASRSSLEVNSISKERSPTRSFSSLRKA